MNPVISSYAMPALLGLLIGVLFSPVSLMVAGAGLGMYDAAVPVLEMKGTVIGRAADSVDVRITGSKNRNCSYMNIQAYTDVGPGGLTKHAYIDRIDRPETGVTRPPGVMDIGVWRIWPVKGEATVTVFVQHTCDGRIVLTKVAEVAL